MYCITFPVIPNISTLNGITKFYYTVYANNFVHLNRSLKKPYVNEGLEERIRAKSIMVLWPPCRPA